MCAGEGSVDDDVVVVKERGKKTAPGEGNLSALEQNKTRTVAEHEKGAQLGKRWLAARDDGPETVSRELRLRHGVVRRTARCQKPRRRSVRVRVREIAAFARSLAALEGHSSPSARTHTRSGS